MAVRDFAKRAALYADRNAVQKEVCGRLLQPLSEAKFTNILDIGCGCGEVYSRLCGQTELFVGVDAADTMCALHPKKNGIELFHANFDDPALFEALKDRHGHFSLCTSNCAIQWSKNIESLLCRMAAACDNTAIAVFTSNTFASLYQASGLETFLPQLQTTKKMIEKHFDGSFEIFEQKLEFSNGAQALKYIRKSGVGLGAKKLTVAQTKALMRDFQPSVLEFEALLFWGRSKSRSFSIE